jgi:hypothetical protein
VEQGLWGHNLHPSLLTPGDLSAESTTAHADRQGDREATSGSIDSLFTRHPAGHTGSNTNRRGDHVEQHAAWTVPEVQDLLDEWLIAGSTGRSGLDVRSDLRRYMAYLLSMEDQEAT